MTDPLSFTKMVPGFDFLQGLVKNAGAALPNVGHWIAPTLDPEELEKRIQELRTVQFWLEQNARMLGATIQALEVQRMTLSTLKTMNVSLGDLTESLKIRVPEPAPAAPAPRAAAPQPAPEPTPAPAPEPEAAADAPAPSAPPGVIDPMQWWGALTKQFTDLAASAMNESATDAAKNLAGAMVKQSFDAAGETLKKAAAMPGNMVKTAASVAQRAASAAGSVAESAAGAATPAGKAAARAAAGKTGASRAAPAKKAAARKAASKRAAR